MKQNLDFKLRKKPFFISWFTQHWQWVAFHPWIWYPKNMKIFHECIVEKGIVEHEKEHLNQQLATGKWRWLWKYFTNKEFKLEQEVKAIAIELKHRLPIERDRIINAYARDLAGKPYSFAAGSESYAKELILIELERYGIEI